jgi:hypothetical protein
MTHIAEIVDRLRRLAKRREDEGIYTDAELCEEAARLLEPSAAIGAGGQAVAELHGPFGWLNGHRALAEDSWTLESDPLENSAEYFAVPLYALVDPFKEIGKDFDGKPALAHPQPLPLKEEVERVVEALRKARQLVDIATDWNLDEVEIDGEMVKTHSLGSEFDAILLALAAKEGRDNG